MKQAKICLLACHYRTYTGCIKKGDHLIFINIGFDLQKRRRLALGFQNNCYRILSAQLSK